MPSSRTEPASIASRLVWRFTIAAALILSCGLGVMYLIMVRHAFAEDKAFLADKISALRADLSHPRSSTSLTDDLSHTGGRSTYWIRVIDANGRTTNETAGMAELLPPQLFPPPRRSDAVRLSGKNYHVRRQLFFLTTTATGTGNEASTLQVAQDRSDDEQFTREFGALLMVVLALGVVASIVTARTVTRQGLRPLETMRASLERITPTRLKARFSSPQWPRELQPLAAGFDQMLDRLENSFERLSQFSADLAHELRTPVANILGESQVALSRPRGADDYRQVIESNAAECERLSAIIENLLFLARADAAEEQIHRTVFDGRAALEKILAFYEPAAEEQGVTMAVLGNGQICADMDLFRRAIGNLLDNALRFTPKGGKIQISISQETEHALAKVSDTGTGIAAEHLPHIFDRFYRADRSRSSEGTGLGLALVKSIMDLHEGKAVATSEPGHGTVITLDFPAQR